ncbi:ExeM/NucH family extracellular endonuclease [Pseudoxanthomonas sp.]|uniref:ExeM/NucH family extracellular endonuclease n=1 Tax=Pseudoxanthomonas sp. TaxID=1871049 RepID=UPI00261F7861|nr:ExeM/NucH family extracellular endonuclease [Pseudoxanthomonas sp.]WDS35354.1 MAG: ExeM/NucH family extracellular endonuclease [Pseudoxanthomonas sp.]
MSPNRPLLLSLSLAALCACASAPARAEAPLKIGQVQGHGAGSALVGKSVTVEGTVTADFRDGLGGFFLQDEGDGNDGTSDAVFVTAAPGTPLPDVHAGQRWQITGVVNETGRAPDTVTTLQLSQARMLGPALVTPRPKVLTAPPTDWAALEGMRVRIDVPLTLDGTDTRFGQTIASFGGRLWAPSERAVAGSPAMAAVIADNARRRIVLDDGSDARDPKTLPYLPNGPVRTGSTATGVTGIVDFRHDAWRLQVTQPLKVEAAARPAPPQVPGNLKIAVFNLENLFNGDGNGGGFPTLRGAKTLDEWKAQVAKLVATLTPLDADIAALMELENDGYGPQSSLAQFVDALNATGSDWRYIDAGSGPGDNPIRVGLIYRASKVTPVGKPAVLEGGPFVEHSRVPLAQAFRRGTGPVFVVAANHFKSKGCGQAAGSDADQHDGAGCWNATRTESARRVDAWLKSDPTGQQATRTLIVGDLNAYAQETPLVTLRGAGWADAFAVAKVESPYSYVYDGQTGRLDHALLSPALTPHLKGAAEWHANADEPFGDGYEGADVTGPWRSSDHDPMLLGFDL